MKKDVIISQKGLKIISKNDNEIITKARYGPSKNTKIPLKMSNNLSFFVATIIGDGHLRTKKFQIIIELSDLNLMNYIKKICKILFCREFNINLAKKREKRKQTYVMCMDSKAIHKLLEEVFEIPPGRKSHIVNVPKHIINSNKEIKKAFLKGIMATEGGRRRRGFGLSTASKQLWNGLKKLFDDIKIPILVDKWEHKKYKKNYYGITFRKDHMKNLMWMCRSGQTG